MNACFRNTEAFRRLSRLLMDAAGLSEDDRKYIRAITVRCSYDEIVSFTIEKFGDEADIAKAMEVHANSTP